MTRIILVILIVGISNQLYGQDHRLQIDQLLDSARSLWYVDFDKTDQLLDEAEKLIKSQRQGNAAELIIVYETRLNSCNAFSRIQLWREYLSKIDSLLVEHRSELGDNYQFKRLNNELLRAQYYFAISDDTKALDLFVAILNEHKSLPESAKNCSRIHQVGNEIAGIHTRRGEHEASINQLLAGIPYLECVDRILGEKNP